MRCNAHFHTAGKGHLYQGRFKSFPIQDDEHFFVACRYVKRNALRARIVSRAEDWRLVITHISGWEFDISIFAMSFDGQALRLCCQMAEI